MSSYDDINETRLNREFVLLIIYSTIYFMIIWMYYRLLIIIH